MNKFFGLNLETHDLEKMRYVNNTSSYKFGLVAILCSLVACFIGLNSVAPDNIGTMIIILVNIGVLLFGFLSCEKVKVYNLKYSYYMYVLAAVNFARMFWYPLTLLVNYPKFTKVINEGVAAGKSYTDAHSQATALYSSKLGVTVMGKPTESGISSTGYLFRNGTVRGWVIISFLAVSVVCFLVAAFINQNKSRKLNAYLKELKK